MEKILVSACLIGDKVRYDGKSNFNPDVLALRAKFDLVPFCPEVEGGLKIPRIPSEIIKDRVVSEKGHDVTKEFELGARKALNICLYLNIKKAVLKSNSPSCGKDKVYNGYFTHTLVNGDGVTVTLLRRHGIEVYTEEEIDLLLNPPKEEIITEEETK